MNQIKRALISTILFLVVFFLYPYNGFSDPGNPCDQTNPDLPPPCGCPGDNENPACPIDGGVVALLAAGVGYGIKRARDSRKNNVVS